MRTKASEVVAYQPIDESLERPRVRILRAIRHHDWITSADLGKQLEIPSERHAWNCHAVLMARLVREGRLERRGSLPFHYRITAVGLHEIDSWIRRGVL